MLADADLENEEVAKLQDKRYLAEIAQKKVEAARVAAKRVSEHQLKLAQAAEDSVDYHFGTDDIFEENVQLKGDNGAEANIDLDDDYGPGYPNISSSGGCLIKSGC